MKYAWRNIQREEADRMKKSRLLDIIAAHRTVTDLDEILKKDKNYQEALAEE